MKFEIFQKSVLLLRTASGIIRTRKARRYITDVLEYYLTQTWVLSSDYIYASRSSPRGRNNPHSTLHFNASSAVDGFASE